MNIQDMADLYSYRVDWSAEDEAFVARVTEWPSLVAHGKSREAALKEIVKVVSFSIEDCQESDDEFPQPFGAREFSGRFNVRLPASLHRELVTRAAEEGVSLNQLVTTFLAKSTA